MSPLRPEYVLVVDDDPVMRELLTALLSAEEYTVEAAESGEAALARLQAGPHAHIILTDIQLPGLFGAALAAELRAVAPHARLLGMSGSEPGAATRAAFDAFLLKPFSMEDFASAIQTQAAAPVTPAAQESEASGPAAPSLAAPGFAAPLDEAIYNNLAASLSAAHLEELYRLTLDDVTERLARMQDALAEGDFDTYRREAHALKGGCSMVGARELAALAAKAEFIPEGAVVDTTLASFATAFVRFRVILAARFIQNK